MLQQPDQPEAQRQNINLEASSSSANQQVSQKRHHPELFVSVQNCSYRPERAHQFPPTPCDLNAGQVHHCTRDYSHTNHDNQSASR